MEAASGTRATVGAYLVVDLPLVASPGVDWLQQVEVVLVNRERENKVSYKARAGESEIASYFIVIVKSKGYLKKRWARR